MPAGNIKTDHARTGELEGGQIDEVMFEGYGPGGAAVLVMRGYPTIATATVSRYPSHVFQERGNLGEQGQRSWMFRAAKSQIVIDKEIATEDQLN